MSPAPGGKKTGRRVSLTLDTAILPERVIARRLETLSRQSGTDWLRSLLTQGLLVEGRGHQGSLAPVCHNGNAPQERPPSEPIVAQHPMQKSKPSSSRMPEALKNDSSAKPFSRLGAIIG